MSYNLFLDDVRQPEQCIGYVHSMGIRPDTYVKYKWDVVKNYQEFTQIINERGIPNVVSFDHDLAAIHYDPKRFAESFTYYEESGLDCAKFLVKKCYEAKVNLPECYVHSMNPVGRQNIINELNDYGKSER